MVSIRAFTSVSVSIPEDTVLALGTGVAELSVGTMASAVPIAVAGEKNPMSAREIERYTGSLRVLAVHAFDRDSVKVNANRFLNQMINRLPANETVTADTIDAAWTRTVGGEARAKMPEAVHLGATLLGDCQAILGLGQMTVMRACLAFQHDVLAAETTAKVWKALKPGS